MYKLPMNLSDLDHFRSNPMIQFKEETVNGVEVVIPCYMIATPELWREPYALELRGNVYRKDTGQLISAALPKFFNVGENEWTQKSNLPWHQGFVIRDKKDGSMITFALIEGKVFAKTKKSFYSDVAKEAQKFIELPENKLLYISIESWLSHGISPIYEFWHPDWQIVLHYGDSPTMMYLGYRELQNNRWQGTWFPTNEQTSMFKSTSSYACQAAEIEAWQKTATDVEGVVVQFYDGRIVKLKTEWYLQQHRVRTDMRERDIAELAALEKLDDIKSIVSDAGLDLSKIEVIETRVAEIITSIKQEVEESAKDCLKFESAKDCALHYKGHKHFKFIMQVYRGQEPDYVAEFLQNHLKEDFGLKCVYNEKF